jgi:hypothetical protein
MIKQHCWTGKSEWIKETYGMESEEYCAYQATREEYGHTCMLPAGHDGPHEFTPDIQIVVEFQESRE